MRSRIPMIPNPASRSRLTPQHAVDVDPLPSSAIAQLEPAGSGSLTLTMRAPPCRSALTMASRTTRITATRSGRRDGAAGLQVELHVDSHAARDFLCRLRDDLVEWLVRDAAEGCHCRACLVQRPSGGGRHGAGPRRIRAAVERELARLGGDEGELLRQPVVQLACDAAALLADGDRMRSLCHDAISRVAPTSTSR